MYSDSIGVSSHVDQNLKLPTIERSTWLNEAQISIVGGGFAGTGTVLRLIESYHQHQVDRAIKVRWYDYSDSFGRGLPYRDQGSDRANEVFILNQPASRMSLFTERPNHFVDWLAARHEIYDRDSFVPRAIYGQYMEEQLELAERSIAGHGLKIIKINQKVPARMIAQSVADPLSYLVDARGHQPNTRFVPFEDNPTFVSEPYRLNSYPSAVQSASSIALIGNGASAIDAIRACEFLGFKGIYTVIAGTLAYPWPYWPKAYEPETFGIYSPKLFSDMNIQGIMNSGCEVYRNLCKLLNKEIRHAIYDGFGPGHVYYSIDLEKIVDLANKIEGNSRVFDDTVQFARLVTFYRRAPTPPENIGLLKRLQISGRIKPVRARVSVDDIIFDETNNIFEIDVGQSEIGLDRDSKNVLGSVRAEILVNCAPFQNGHSRATTNSAQLLDRTRRASHFEVGSCAFSNTTFPRTWGVESFREELREVAKTIIESIESYKVI